MPSALADSGEAAPECYLGSCNHPAWRAAVGLVVPIVAAEGHTSGMKTAISIPDDVFQDAEYLAHKMKKSRSEIYSRAVREYVARYAGDRVTEALDALNEEPAVSDEFMQAAARNTLKSVEW